MTGPTPTTPRDAAPNSSTAPLLEARALRFRFAAADRDALHVPELLVRPGERILLAGRSGSGKSTLLKVLSGLWPTSGLGERSGAILLDGAPIETAAPFAGGALGLLLQSPEEQVLATRVRDEVLLSLRSRRELTKREMEARLEEALQAHGIGRLAGARVDALSGGERQRVVLAALDAAAPRLLLLDEPFAHADGAAAEALSAYLGALPPGRGLLVAEHRCERVLPSVDRILLMAEGRVLLDAPRDRALIDPEPWRRAGLPLPFPARLFAALGRPERPIGIAQAAALLSGDAQETEPERGGGTTEPERGGGTAEPERSGAGGAESVRSGEATEPSVDRSVGNFRGPAPVVLRVRELTAGWGGEAVLRNISASAKAEERIALLGANGSGKSTLFAAISGALKPVAGAVHIEPVAKPGAPARYCGLVPQQPELALICPSVADELRSSLRRIDGPLPPALRRAAERAGLAEHLDAPPWALSRGQRLRLAVQSQLVRDPAVLLLDEPTAGQDPEILEQLLTDLGGGPGVLIFSTHDLSAALTAADRVWLLHDGALAFDGPPAELLRDDELCRRARLARPPVAELCAALGSPPSTDEEDLIRALRDPANSQEPPDRSAATTPEPAPAGAAAADPEPSE